MSEDDLLIPKPKRQRHFIKEWRKKRGFTQEDLAAAVGVSIPTISQIENYKTGFTGETLSALANALSVSRGDLLENDPNQDSSLWHIFETLKTTEDSKKDEILRVINAMLDTRKAS